MVRSEEILEITKGMVKKNFVTSGAIIIVILQKGNIISSSSIDDGEGNFWY